MKVKVYIPVFSDTMHAKTFALGKGNPGIGGTQFTSIYLALCLAQRSSNWKIILISNSILKLENPRPNLEQKTFTDLSEFFSSLEDKESQVIIAPASLLTEAKQSLLEKFKDKIICWSHHPFDPHSHQLLTQVRLKDVVCVGIYQYYTNQKLKANVHHIQNVFVASKALGKQQETKFAEKNIDIVYLGALNPAKGFLEIAKSWSLIKERFANVKLHVIGSSATYGEKVGSKLIPTSLDYANEILQFIPERDIHSGKVVFYGNLGEEKFEIIRKCDLALLNPTGVSEAFPASPLECMACGVPVIASNDYGMSDCMRFFPELAIRGHKDIVVKIEWLMTDSLKYLEMQQRSVTVARWFEWQTDQILTRWIRLITTKVSAPEQSYSLLPSMPFCGNYLALVYRRDIKPNLRKLKANIFNLSKPLKIFR